MKLYTLKAKDKLAKKEAFLVLEVTVEDYYLEERLYLETDVNYPVENIFFTPNYAGICELYNFLKIGRENTKHTYQLDGFEMTGIGNYSYMTDFELITIEI